MTWQDLQAVSTNHQNKGDGDAAAVATGLIFLLDRDGVRLASHSCMVVRIVTLADGEELISFESGEQRVRAVVDDPRTVLLAHRRSAERESDGSASSADGFSELQA